MMGSSSSAIEGRFETVCSILSSAILDQGALSVGGLARFERAVYRLNIYDELLNTLNGGADDDGGETLVKNLAQERLRIIDEAVMLAGRNFLTACNMLQIHEHVTGRNGKIGDGLDIDADEVASSM